MDTANVAVLVPLVVGIGLCLIGGMLTLATRRRSLSPLSSQPRDRRRSSISLPEGQQTLSDSSRRWSLSSAAWLHRAVHNRCCPSCGRTETDIQAHFCGCCGQPLRVVRRTW